MLVDDNGTLTLPDATNPVDIYHIGGDHAEDMVLIYLTEQKILFNGDLYSPFSPNPSTPMSPTFKSFANDLHDALQSGNWPIDNTDGQVIGVHGAPGGVPITVFFDHYNL